MALTLDGYRYRLARVVKVGQCAGVPGDGKGSAGAGLDTLTGADAAWGLDDRAGGVCQAAGVCIDAHCSARPAGAARVHQHHSVAHV